MLAALDETGHRIETVGRLHRLLARRNDPETIEITEFVEEIARATLSSQAYAARARLTFSFAATCAAPPRQALPMGLIVGELVTNSLKYAHPTGVRGEIMVSCRRNRDGGIDIEVADDGVGLPEGFQPELADSLGLTLVRGLARQIGARLTFLRKSIGLTVRLSAPP
ncbi:MAG TPA: sensor histidine kinase [Caulobacteraceae bacterium]